MSTLWPAMLAMSALVPTPALTAEPPAARCHRLGTDDALRPIPDSLVASINRAFGISMPARAAVASTVYRCVDGRVAVCTVGANLPCGKARAERPEPES